MKPPTIVYIHNRPIPSMEANGVAVMHMCAALSRQGANIKLTTFGGEKQKDVFEVYGLAQNFEVWRLPALKGPLAYPGLVCAALAGAPFSAIVYTRIPQVAVYALMAKRRVVLEMHYPIGELRRGRWALKFLNRPNSKLLAVVAINATLRDRLAEELPLATALLIVAPTAAPDFGGDEGRAKPFDVGFVGSFYGGRGLDLILSLAERAPDLRFLLVGGPITEALTSRAQGLSNLVLHPPIEHREISKTLGLFEIGLAPYEERIQIANSPIDTARWMSPMKIIEYMSAEKAIIASKLPALLDLLDDEVNALLVPPSCPDLWFEALQRLKNPTLRKSLSAAARRRFVKDLSWDTRAATILASLRSSHSFGPGSDITEVQRVEHGIAAD